MVKIFAKDLQVKARVFDLETGRNLKGVIWVDEEAGMAESYALDSSGCRVPVLDKDGNQHWKTHILKGRFKLIFGHQERPNFNRLISAPSCALCRSPLVLSGDELCPACKAKDRGKPFKCEPCNPLDQHRCEKCSRAATWSVADEVEVSPQRALVSKAGKIPNGVYLFRRRAVVGRKYYCASHFQGPRLLDHRGEVMAVEETPHNPDA